MYCTGLALGLLGAAAMSNSSVTLTNGAAFKHASL